MLLSDVEIITDGGRRRRWSAAEKLRIVEESLDRWQGPEITLGMLLRPFPVEWERQQEQLCQKANSQDP